MKKLREKKDEANNMAIPNSKKKSRTNVFSTQPCTFVIFRPDTLTSTLSIIQVYQFLMTI